LARNGGHYENLGLVELLRRRCRVIYCVDASGDTSLAQTLAQAASLAYEELGVQITIEDAPLLSPSSEMEGKAPNLELRALERRLASKPGRRWADRLPSRGRAGGSLGRAGDRQSRAHF
jgi:hypothetical protein